MGYFFARDGTADPWRAAKRFGLSGHSCRTSQCGSPDLLVTAQAASPPPAVISDTNTIATSSMGTAVRDKQGMALVHWRQVVRTGNR